MTSRNIAALLAVLGAALLVLQWSIDRPLWLDEEILAINLRDRGVLDYFGPLWLDESAPLGWLLAGRASLLTLGTAERALRLVPVFFGLATIATAAWVGRRWMTSIGAVVLVLLCSWGQWLTFYYVELHPYSADVCFSLLLPAVAAWAVDAPDRHDTTRRAALFWLLASIGQLFANGALFVTPACGLLLIVAIARRDGWRQTIPVAVAGFLWLATFVLNYVFVLRHALSSPYLSGVWAFAFPPRGAGPIDTLRWFGGTLAAFAGKPGGARIGAFFWIAATAGLALAGLTGRRVAWFFATVPASLCLLAAFRLVPLYERLSIWAVPALYVGIALLADFAFKTVAQGFSPAIAALKGCATKNSEMKTAAGVVAFTLAAFVCGDIVWQGVTATLDLRRSPQQNRALDDRTAVRWLAARKQSGDIWMTTHYGVPAVWWYAGIHEKPILEVSYEPPGPRCRQPIDLVKLLGPAPRILVYLGFRFDDVPAGFDDLLVAHVSRLGSVAGYRPVDEVGHVLVIDRLGQPGSPTTLSQLAGKMGAAAPSLRGCLLIREASVSTYDEPTSLW